MNRADLHRVILLVNETGVKLRDAIAIAGKATSEAINESAEATKQVAKKPPPSRLTVDVQIPREEADRYYAEQLKTLQLQRRTLHATVATFVAVAFYAIVAYLQWSTMDATFREVRQQSASATNTATTAKDSLQLARDNFIKDQRPYLLITKIFPDPQIAPGKVMYWRIEQVNYGRSPAINTIGRTDVFNGMNALSQANDFFAKLPKRFVRNVGSQGIVGPNAPAVFSSIRSHGVITPAEVTFITTHDLAVAVVGRLQYEDLSGNTYYTDFCYSTFVTGAITYCPTHNEIH